MTMTVSLWKRNQLTKNRTQTSILTHTGRPNSSESCPKWHLEIRGLLDLRGSIVLGGNYSFSMKTTRMRSSLQLVTLDKIAVDLTNHLIPEINLTKMGMISIKFSELKILQDSQARKKMKMEGSEGTKQGWILITIIGSLVLARIQPTRKV